MALHNSAVVEFPPSREVAESRNQALKLQKVWILFTELHYQFGFAGSRNARVFSGANWKTMDPVRNVEFAARALEAQLEFAALQHRTIVIVKHRQQHLAMQLI